MDPIYVLTCSPASPRPEKYLVAFLFDTTTIGLSFWKLVWYSNLPATTTRADDPRAPPQPRGVSDPFKSAERQRNASLGRSSSDDTRLGSPSEKHASPSDQPQQDTSRRKSLVSAASQGLGTLTRGPFNYYTSLRWRWYTLNLTPLLSKLSRNGLAYLSVASAFNLVNLGLELSDSIHSKALIALWAPLMVALCQRVILSEARAIYGDGASRRRTGRGGSSGVVQISFPANELDASNSHAAGPRAPFTSNGTSPLEGDPLSLGSPSVGSGNASTPSSSGPGRAKPRQASATLAGGVTLSRPTSRIGPTDISGGPSFPGSPLSEAPQDGAIEEDLEAGDVPPAAEAPAAALSKRRQSTVAGALLGERRHSWEGEEAVAADAAEQNAAAAAALRERAIRMDAEMGHITPHADPRARTRSSCSSRTGPDRPHPPWTLDRWTRNSNRRPADRCRSWTSNNERRRCAWPALFDKQRPPPASLAMGQQRTVI